MAWLFELAAECATPADAAALAAHFHERELVLDEGLQSVCRASWWRGGEGCWVRVVPSGVSRHGVGSPEDAAQMTVVGHRMYELLQAAPPFRYALVGVETEEFAEWSELADPDAATVDGLVLCLEAFRRAGCPVELVHFAPGYRWRPWGGERAPA